MPIQYDRTVFTSEEDDQDYHGERSLIIYKFFIGNF